MQDAKIREVAAEIYQIHMPLPMRPSIVNIHLVRDQDEWALFDTGMHTEESVATLKSAIEQVGCPPSAIRKLICTHHHADHFGTSRTYKEMTGAEVYLNPLEQQRVERMQSNLPSPEAMEFFRAHGLPLDEFPNGLPSRPVTLATAICPSCPIIRLRTARRCMSETGRYRPSGRRVIPPVTAAFIFPTTRS